jgi:hypothetical protein
MAIEAFDVRDASYAARRVFNDALYATGGAANDVFLLETRCILS